MLAVPASRPSKVAEATAPAESTWLGLELGPGSGSGPGEGKD